MKPVRKPSEVKAEVFRLRKIKDSIEPLSLFGEDYHRTIDAIIEAIERNLTLRQAIELFRAARWINCQSGEPPSSRWQKQIVEVSEI